MDPTFTADKKMRLVRNIEKQIGKKINSGIDIVGDIAIVRLEGKTQAEKHEFASMLLKELKNVRTVYEQAGPVEGIFRLKKLIFLAGEKKSLTLHKENGILLKVDVERCYFSPRLSSERKRVLSKTKIGESVLNMFAGVGPFSILLAKKARCRVTSIELNTCACRLHNENCSLNKVTELIDIINSDSYLADSMLNTRYDRIIMPLPTASNIYIEKALELCKKGGTIHYYRAIQGRNKKEVLEKLGNELAEKKLNNYEIGMVREIGEHFYEVSCDIHLN